MNLIKKCFWLLAILAGLWFLPGLIPLKSVLSEVESRLSSSVGVSVTIADARFALLPSPRVIAYDIRLGGDNGLWVESLAVVPHWTALWTLPRPMRVEVTGAKVGTAALSLFQVLQAQPSASAGMAAPVMLQGIRMRRLDVQSVVPLPLLNVEVALDRNLVQSAHLATEDGALSMDVLPQGELQQIRLKLKHFKTPLSALVVDEGTVEMHLSPDVLLFDHIQLGLLEGELEGRGRVAWQSRVRAEGQFSLQHVSLQPLTQTQGQAYLSGYLSGHGQLSASAQALDKLLSQLQLQAQLVVNQGTLHGVDLIKLAKLMVKRGARGGETQFDTLNTQLKIQGRRLDFKSIEMASGLMTATGDVTVLANQQLKGALNVAVKHSAGLLEVPLEITGPVNDPVIFPNRGAAIGAAVGTALLPGVGTSVGMKMGERLKNMFSQ